MTKSSNENNLKPPGVKEFAKDIKIAADSYADNRDDIIRSMFPYGNGSPAMVVPGFMTHDVTARDLGNFISSLGHAGKKWKGGLHLGISDYKLQHFSDRLKYVFRKHGERPVSLLGWSLGGVVSREMARRHPEMVAQVITMGSPFKAPLNPDSTHLKVAFDCATQIDQKIGATKEIIPEIPAFLKHQLGKGASFKDRMIMGVAYPVSCVTRMLKQPDVLIDQEFALATTKPIEGIPCTYIYTQNDGVVHWQTCIDDENDLVQNIEVGTSHMGLGFDAAVRLIIADRLYHNDKNQGKAWTKFDPKAYEGSFDFNAPMAHQRL